jgi:hypothetical protein
MREGCLSFPGVSEIVIRNKSIDVEWYDENGKYHRDFFHGISSRILQHEIDHLKGVLMSVNIKSVKLVPFCQALEKIIYASDNSANNIPFEISSLLKRSLFLVDDFSWEIWSECVS